MAKQKRRSTAAKQRAKARRQQRAARGGAGPEPASPPPPARSPGATRPARRGARRPGVRRRGTRRTPWVAIGAVLVVVAIFVVVALAGRRDDTERGRAAPGSIEKLTSIPAATLEAVGIPAELSNVHALPADTPPIEEDGKPLVLYYGAEYCPFCAVERWPMVIALSRFGTFEGLSSTTSAPPPETLPNTPTVTFHGATYRSDHLVFSAVETQDRHFQPLETPTELQQRLFDTYNVPSITGSQGAIPFVMIGNRYAWAGSQYDPGVLEGKTFDEIVAALQDPSTEIARQIGGTANVITAMICELTGGRPAEVCSTELIAQAQAALPEA